MDNMAYRVNEAMVLVHYLETSQTATAALYTGRNYDLISNQQKTTGALGLKGIYIEF